MTKPESLVVKVLVRTYILTIQTQVFLFKSNYGTAVDRGLLLFQQFNAFLVNENNLRNRFFACLNNISFILSN